MKRVLFVIKTLCRGGAERALSNIVTHFPDDWHIDILVDDESMIEYPYKGNVFSLSMPEKNSMVYFVKNIIKRTVYLRKLKKTGNYNACISFLESSNISNIFSGNKYCRTFVSIRSNMMSPNYKSVDRIVVNFLIKKLYIHADQIIVVSSEIESEIVNTLKVSENKVRTIVNGFDRKWIMEKTKVVPENMMTDSGWNKKDYKTVITVGRMVEPKGQWHLIRAFSKVAIDAPQARLMIVGDGPLHEYLTTLAGCYGLEEKVVFTGRCDNPFWYLAHADIFVLPSLYEGYPNALGEAVCCGIPCIAADVHSGSREILAPDLNVAGERVEGVSEEKYGILVPACSGRKYIGDEALEAGEQKLADAILRLLNDDKKRRLYRQRSMERSMDLDINIVTDQWIDAILGD